MENMNGGLMKTASRFAIAATATVLATSAMAADLGGNCCADLEERIAELEATTARKGNRKVSLTISGQINESIMYWDDGVEQNIYYGVNHINSSSRFRFTGDAKFGGDWSAGYLMEIETQAKSDSNDMVQFDQSNGSGVGVVVRHNAWWIDNKTYGRTWVGLTDPASVGITSINLANTNVAANPKPGLTNSAFRLRGNQGSGVISARTWGSILGGNNGIVNLGDETRQNLVKYVSPTFMGFIFATSMGEDDFWDASLKYANEFNGVRVAAGIGYFQTTDANPGFPNSTGTGNQSNHWTGCADLGTVANSDQKHDRDCSSWAIAGSIMHVPTGLFVSASYEERKDDFRHRLAVLNGATGVSAIDDTDTFWQVRSGIERNWFGLGKTTAFGEFMHFDGTPLGGTGGSAGTFNNTDVALAGFVAPIVNSEVDVWGLGVVQSIDAAAMDLYLTYRNYGADLKTSTNGVDTQTVTGLKDWQAITFGGIIRF